MQQTLLQKLQWKDQKSLLVLDAPEELRTVLANLAGTLTIVRRVPRKPGVSFVLAFVKTENDVQGALTRVTPILAEDTLLWFAYPKQTSKRYAATITRDRGWDPLGVAGYEAVRQIAIDENWSALRFRSIRRITRLSRNPTRMISRRGRQSASGDRRA